MMDNTGTIDWSMVTKLVSLLLYISQSISQPLFTNYSLIRYVNKEYIFLEERKAKHK